MAKIFITGASGFIGYSLTKFLAKNHDVKVLIRNKASEVKFNKLRVDVVVGEISERFLSDKLNGIDYVYHLAAERETNLTKEEYYNSNVNTTIELIKACKKAEIKKLIYLSTVHVHGFPKKLPVTETSPYDPKTLYAESKMLAEKKIIETMNLNYTIVRSSLVYGPGDISQIIIKLKKFVGEKIGFIVGYGKNRIQLIYVDDLIRGLAKMMDRKADHEIFMLSSNQPIRINSLITTLCKYFKIRPLLIHIPLALLRLLALVLTPISRALNRELLLTEQRIDIISKDRFFSIDKAKTLLSFSPRVGYDKGLKKTLSWYEKSVWFDC